LSAYQRSGLSADYVEKRNGLIQAVTLAKVNEMAKKYFDPEHLVIVIAGTPAIGTAQQKAAGTTNAAPAPAPAR
jgi:predicted Zn-dependent peptidase